MNKLMKNDDRKICLPKLKFFYLLAPFGSCHFQLHRKNCIMNFVIRIGKTDLLLKGMK